MATSVRAILALIVLVVSVGTASARNLPPAAPTARNPAPASTIATSRIRVASRLMKFCKTSSAAVAAPFADGGELICDLTTASSRQRGGASDG